jgi:acetyltransferase
MNDISNNLTYLIPFLTKLEQFYLSFQLNFIIKYLNGCMLLENSDIIQTFLHPKSVAVIGASKKFEKGGFRITTNLITNNYKGKVYLVNPNAEGKLYNLEFNKSILDIKDDIDIAIFYVPNRFIPDLLEECIKKGVKGAIIEASGFEEVGSKGLELKKRLVEITNNFTKIRIVGPNCMGLSTFYGDSDSEDKEAFLSGFGIFSTFKRGNIGLISQSGMLNGGYLMHIMTQYPHLGFRYSCSIGNKTDISELEFLEYMIKDDTVNVIAIYLESFKDPRKFIELCKKAKYLPNKTILLLRGGITSQGQKATRSHTGSMAENARLIQGIIKQAGVIYVNSFYELFQYARSLSIMHKTGKTFPKKGYVSFLAGSGGAGTLIADLTMKHGLKLPILEDNTYSVLVDVFPEWMPPNKFAFVDIWPAMEKAMMNMVKPEVVTSKVYKALVEDPNVEGVFNMLFCSKQFKALNDISEIIDIANKSPKPFFFWLVGEAKEVQRISDQLGKHNLPNFPSLEDMVKNFKILVQNSNSAMK